MRDLDIRRAQVSDAAAFVQMMSDPEVYGGLLQLPFPTEDAWRTRLAEQASPGKSDLHLVATRGTTLLGSAGLHPCGASLRRRHAMMIGISVATGEQRKGVGSALMSALLDYADNWIQVLRLELTVYTDNEPAIRLYKRFGFEVEGVLRAYAMRAGEFVDVLSMARLHPKQPMLRE